MFFWNNNKTENGEMDGGGGDGTTPLLKDDELTNPTVESSSLDGGGDEAAVAAGGLEQQLEQDDDGTVKAGGGGRRGRRQIPTMVFIVGPTILFVVALFLAAVFMPPSPSPPHQPAKNETGSPTGSRGDKNETATGGNSGGENKEEEEEESMPPRSKPFVAFAPTLLSVRDSDYDDGGTLLNVHDHFLYGQLKRAVFHHHNEGESEKSPGMTISLLSDRNEIGFGDALTLAWTHGDESNGSGGPLRAAVDDGGNGNDDDVLALYCPAAETDPKNFRDAATLAQARATHAHRAAENNDGWGVKERKNVWSIPSFPVVREESCEFRLYSHHRSSDAYAYGAGTSDEGLPALEHYYTLVATTGPIFLTSNQSPTCIHIGLTGKPSEMFIQFATGDSGEPLAEVAKKSDIHKARRRLAEAEEGEWSGTSVSWAKHKGSSRTYTASDMCQEPATSTDPGFFVSPGHLHTVRVTGLEPNTDYVYRVGLGFGQGVKWSDKYHTFRSSPPPGAGPPTPGKPALTFLALADQGCKESNYKSVVGEDPPKTPPAPDDVNPAGQVTNLISSMMDNRTIDSIHHIGGLSYADGAAHAWDVWMNAVQAYASRAPLMVGVGNHEYDHDAGGGDGKDPSGVTTDSGFMPEWGEGSFGNAGGECGIPASGRFAAPDGGNSVFWYSYEQSLAHVTMLSTEHNATVGSPQYTWLENDLKAVNRSVTPWIIVEMHRPMYNSELFGWSGPMVTEGLQNEIEDLLRAYSVDFVISGHYHSYFRSCDGLYSYECNAGGPTFVTVGTGGAPLDGHSKTSLIPNDYTEFYDKAHYGVGRATVYNASALLWEFVAVGGDVIDGVWITRNRNDHK